MYPSHSLQCDWVRTLDKKDLRECAYLTDTQGNAEINKILISPGLDTPNETYLFLSSIHIWGDNTDNKCQELEKGQMEVIRFPMLSIDLKLKFLFSKY